MNNLPAIIPSAAQSATDDKLRRLRRMKIIATSAFAVSTILFIIARRFGTDSIFWVVRWDHLSAFAEASMVGALADWFAVVALFKHPLGIPIWHTAIIPKRKEDISKSIRSFVETKLLSVENVSAEIDRFSPSQALIGYLDSEEHRIRVSGWLGQGVGAIVRGMDDAAVQNMLGNTISTKLSEWNAAELLGNGLDVLIENKKHEELLDKALRYVADLAPTHRATVKQFIERAIQRTLKWGSNLVPDAAVEAVTDNVLASLIEVLTSAAENPEHPLRADLCAKAEEWTRALQSDPELQEKINTWKNELVNHPRVRQYIGELWSQLKEWVVKDLEQEESAIRTHALRAVDSFHAKLRTDAAFRDLLDTRLRSGAVSLLQNNHHQIGAVVQRVVDQWDGPRLARELELSLGKDLQYIRLNGTLIGGIVGLLIHLLF